jgi:hypothetical protein
MPWLSMDNVPDSLKGIDPPLTLAQANEVAALADAIGGDNPWGIAVGQWKARHIVSGGRWVKKERMTVETDKIKTDTPIGLLSEAQVSTLLRITAQIVRGETLAEDAEGQHFQHLVREALGIQDGLDAALASALRG